MHFLVIPWLRIQATDMLLFSEVDDRRNSLEFNIRQRVTQTQKLG